MNTSQIISEIDQEIARLEQVKAILTQGETTLRKGQSVSTSDSPVKRRRPLSPEARARIVAAQKKRWAAAKKQGK